MKSKKSAVIGGAALLGVPAALMLACGPAFAASTGDVIVNNTETVQAYLNASGKVDVARVYEQIAMQGKGSVDLVNPVSTKGLRNLDGFGGFEVKGGQMVGTYSVDGERRLRTVSDYTKKLPLEVDVKYTLDGKAVDPGDVVGKSGNLKVQYTVRNVTGQPENVTFNDGTGKEATATENVVIPMIGSLSTVLPSNFTDVRSDEANMAGDGRGGTKMSFTMTLFGPIGQPEAAFGYEAKITDGVIPKASISALPVSPLDSPTFKGGAESYKGGAETGATLTAGATEIDSNLLKLRDGAGDLLAGLIKLKDGANQLHNGLAGQAAPGAVKLADGADLLKDGTGQLAAGATKAKSGAAQVSGGATQLAGGARQLAGGSATLAAGSSALADGASVLDAKLGQYQDGLTLLANGIQAIPANPDYQRLLQGITSIQTAIGDPSRPTTLRGGLTALKSGVTTQLQPGISALIAGVGQLQAGIAAAISSDLPQLKGLAAGAKSALAQVAIVEGCLTVGGTPGPNAATGNCPTLLSGLTQAGTLVVAMDTPIGTPGLPNGGLTQKLQQASFSLDAHTPGTAGSHDPGGVLYGLNALKVGVDNHAPGAHGSTDSGGLEYGLNALLFGTDTHTPGTAGATDPGGLAYGMGAINAGVQSLVNTIVSTLLNSLGTPSTDPTTTLRGGAAALSGGAAQLSSGAGRVASGASQVASGAGALATGSGQLATGAGQLNGGLGDLATGAGKVDSGAGQLKDGANQLSSGLTDAATGSGQLADGLGQAAQGAPKLKDGAQQLSDQGTKKLIEAGKSTAADYGQKYALIEAGAKRAQAEGMAYGAPPGATGQTAYSYELAGADGEGGRNLGRGFGAAAVFGLAGAAAVLRRRFV
ncbi:putative membrane protein [Phycicoccus badiiscoriae]|uniref:Putative membrane protein n=1 Tax=Pedococcus badiiscoriae TaxID=642776 RepID=A0A852WSV0_9MICO|nr:putative membrane protein [Pedococcus badiiscoriae]